jgi:hypothetical protein
MIVEQVKKSEFTIVANGVWICFAKQPSLKDVEEARKLLDQLTDELIKESL